MRLRIYNAIGTLAGLGIVFIVVVLFHEALLSLALMACGYAIVYGVLNAANQPPTDG